MAKHMLANFKEHHRSEIYGISRINDAFEVQLSGADAPLPQIHSVVS